MKKIYFANTSWGNSESLVKNIIDQTPNSLGIWEDVTYTLNKSEADFIIVQDGTPEEVDDSKVIYFGREPKHVTVAYYEWKRNSYGNYHHEAGNCWLPATWWIKHPFNELFDLNPTKTKKISAIDSGRIMTTYHHFRKELVTKLMNDYSQDVDVYGHINPGHSLPPRDKKQGLIDYNYNLVIENGKTDFYFSEKFVDPILLLTMPIYSGCKQISKFFPKGSYIEFDDSKGIDYAISQILEISNSNYREENIENLKEARHLILNKYNIWPTIKMAIDNKKVL
jgi:hypothetical protein